MGHAVEFVFRVALLCFWSGLRPGLSRFKAFSLVFCAAGAWLRVELLPDSASLKIENEEERWTFYRSSVVACGASA